MRKILIKKSKMMKILVLQCDFTNLSTYIQNSFVDAKMKNLLTEKKILSNQLLSNFFSKIVIFTKFFKKVWEYMYISVIVVSSVFLPILLITFWLQSDFTKFFPLPLSAVFYTKCFSPIFFSPTIFSQSLFKILLLQCDFTKFFFFLHIS